MKQLVRDASLTEEIEISSAGTAAYHEGELPDKRSREEAHSRGIELTSRARQFKASNLARYDYVLAMDRENLTNLQALSRDADLTAKIELLRSYDPALSRAADVPDPYYGDGRGFERVFDICEAACRGLLDHIVEHHAIG
jgi:protein-tyrosine phosphatase